MKLPLFIIAAAFVVTPAAPALSAPSPAMLSEGASIYQMNCSACHGATGEGIIGSFPAFARNKEITAADPTRMIRIVKNGHGRMVSPALSDDQIAKVLTYIRNSWGNKASAVTEAQVARVK